MANNTDAKRAKISDHLHPNSSAYFPSIKPIINNLIMLQQYTGTQDLGIDQCRFESNNSHNALQPQNRNVSVVV